MPGPLVSVPVTIMRLLGLRIAIRWLNCGLRRLVAFTHMIQYGLDWGARPRPEWYDHFIDQYWQWRARRLPYGWERGIFNLLAMKPDAEVLELCCGDGFNAYHFYSIRARRIVSLDFDPRAIRHAKRNHRAKNVEFVVGDVRTAMPPGPFDHVVWDAAIEHFTEAEIADLMAQIRRRLKPAGMLSGYTIVEGEHLSHEEHEYEFKSKQDLLRFLEPWFANVLVFETVYPGRHNLYFYASDGPLPFDEGWLAKVESKRASGKAGIGA
ncbi:MAG: class I SAM-dependent methyltransferase [Planctomycetes bacterium]|nr:class I SAM-dependent methyltransferase [Planctomycetota bacterium]